MENDQISFLMEWPLTRMDGCTLLLGAHREFSLSTRRTRKSNLRSTFHVSRWLQPHLVDQTWIFYSLLQQRLIDHVLNLYQQVVSSKLLDLELKVFQWQVLNFNKQVFHCFTLFCCVKKFSNKDNKIWKLQFSWEFKNFYAFKFTRWHRSVEL